MNHLQLLLEKVCTEMNCWAAAIMVPDSTQNVLVCKTGRNLPEDWEALTNPFDDTTLNGKSYMNEEVIIKNGLDQTTVRGAPTKHQIYGIMVLPIKSKDKVIGTLEFINDNRDLMFQESELRLAQKAAKKLAELL